MPSARQRVFSGHGKAPGKLSRDPFVLRPANSRRDDGGEGCRDRLLTGPRGPGLTVLLERAITIENVLDQTTITYLQCMLNELTGAAIKGILADARHNIYKPDGLYETRFRAGPV